MGTPLRNVDQSFSKIYAVSQSNHVTAHIFVTFILLSVKFRFSHILTQTIVDQVFPDDSPPAFYCTAFPPNPVT